MTTTAQRAHIEQVKQQKLDRIQSVISLTDKGMTQRQACDKLGLNHYVMSRNIRRWKREQMSEKDALADEIAYKSKPNRDWALFRLWSEGWKIKDIAAHFGMAVNTVNKILRRNHGYKPYGRDKND